MCWSSYLGFIQVSGVVRPSKFSSSFATTRKLRGDELSNLLRRLWLSSMASHHLLREYQYLPFTLISNPHQGYVISQVFYCAFVHPLSNYPGPLLYAVSYVPYYLDMWLGRMHTVAKDLHDTYGDVVRISPTQLSYNTAGAWKDIYGHRPGKVQLEKDPSFCFKQKEGPSIFISDDADHSRMRRLVSHAFSTQALLEQGPLIMKYVNLLIS